MNAVEEIDTDIPLDCKKKKKKSELCKICLLRTIEKSKCFQFSDCGCLFCTKCMVDYACYLIENHQIPIGCPDGACPVGGELTSEEVQKLVPASLFQRYERLCFERDVQMDPYRLFCPGADCDRVLALAKSKLDNPFLVHCDGCGLNFCSVCRSEWHPGINCKDADIEAIGHDAVEHVKKCPVCRVWIERDQGCAQMVCANCHHLFCWHCLTLLDRDLLLRHYDKGPCKGKLGHSRRRILLHRVQVVALLTGLALVVIAAAPFLLVASPCLIAHKVGKECCHRRRKQRDRVATNSAPESPSPPLPPPQ